MPDRIVRDELLTSERYWGCSAEARNLFVSILLSVDDAARMSASNFVLRTKCMAGTVTHDRIEKLLGELLDCDLVRIYHAPKPVDNPVDKSDGNSSNGARFLFVPRFRNRRRYLTRSKYPEPPIGISDLTEKKADSSQTQVRLKTRGVGVGVGVGVGEHQNGAVQTPKKAGGEKDWKYPKIPPYVHDAWIDREYKAGRLKLRSGETYEQVKSRLIAEREAAK